MDKLQVLVLIDVNVQGRHCKGLIDGGAVICLISEELAREINADECGHIYVRGIFSDPLRVPLVNVTVMRDGTCDHGNVADGIQVVCAIAPLKEMSHSMVLSSDVVTDLECIPVLNVMCVKEQNCDNEVECLTSDCMTTEVNAGYADDDVSAVSVTDNIDQVLVNDVADSNEQLVKAQRNDPTLALCWEKVNNGNYVVDRGILFHYDHVKGQKVCQLCVPECKRNAVLQLSHDSVFGGHHAERKTRERVRLSLHWPKLRQSVKQYLTTYHDCQLRSRPKMLDPRKC